ncbi:chemotaxis protein CheW [Paragemmobacter straminiformis]|uniref:Chemotaxis protein CheW n=1 Tax=Paragemmobacter straminiformis TaxID=2045119 RepID=A0A842IAW6_9RHOB|nr:chemotaxis protein CheW [Gemmobacter straminiformis]MBC2836736.1 chemotaxis protein CheW [Gemmobacter straminiformis]
MTIATAVLQPDSPALTAATPELREFVVFRTLGQDFCIDILCVREIRGWTKPSNLPHAPAFVEGVINLRGAIIPIVDLANRLGLTAIDEDERNVIIVTAIGERVTGLVVETVTDILSVPATDIQPVPDLSSDELRAVLRGLVVHQGRLLRLLDIAAILGTELAA